MSSRFHAYFDLKLACDPGIPEWDRLGVLWRFVHGTGARTGTPFAVAFPGWMERGLFTLGSTLRLFAHDEANAMVMRAALHANQRVTDLAAVLQVKAVPGVVTSFEAYLMRRLPSGISKSRRTIPAEEQQKVRTLARARRLEQQASLPFVRMRSATGAQFRLVVERIAYAAAESGEPNGYGLSRATQIVALPVCDREGRTATAGRDAVHACERVLS